MTTIKLTKPINAHGEEIDSLDLRDPTTEDVIELGLPTLIIVGNDTNSTGIEVRQQVIARYIMKLGGIPMGSVKKLALQDLSACTSVIMGFFGNDGGEETPDQNTSKTAPSK